MKAKVAKKTSSVTRQPPRKVETGDDDRFQAKQARAAIADPRNQKSVPWSKVKRELGL